MKNNIYSKLTPLLFLVFFQVGCSGHVAPIIPVTPPDQKISQPTAHSRIQKIKGQLAQQGRQPVYLYFESITNQSGANGLSKNLKVLSTDVAYQYSPYVEVYTSGPVFTEKILLDKIKGNLCYQVEGAITAYDQNEHTISSGIDLGVDFGEGSKATTNENMYRNIDKVSSLELTVFFKQKGKVHASTSAEIKISSINRGYNFGLRINDSGLGMNSYHTKTDGMGKSLRKLLTFIFADLIDQVIDQRQAVMRRNITEVDDSLSTKGKEIIKRKGTLRKELRRWP